MMHGTMHAIWSRLTAVLIAVAMLLGFGVTAAQAAEPTATLPNADNSKEEHNAVVLVLDTSGGMKDTLAREVAAARRVASAVLTDPAAKVGVVHFGLNVGGFGDARACDAGMTSDAKATSSCLDELAHLVPYGSPNTKRGLEEAQKLLGKVQDTDSVHYVKNVVTMSSFKAYNISPCWNGNDCENVAADSIALATSMSLKGVNTYSIGVYPPRSEDIAFLQAIQKNGYYDIEDIDDLIKHLVGDTDDEKAKINASLSFIAEQAWFNNGSYIGAKLPMELTVTVDRSNGNNANVSINSAVVTLPENLSFDRKGDIQSKDIKDLLQIHEGTETPNGWAQQLADFDVYIKPFYMNKRVDQFTASVKVSTSVGDVESSASLPVKDINMDFQLVDRVNSWYSDPEISSELNQYVMTDPAADGNITSMWYQRYAYAAKLTGMDTYSSIWQHLSDLNQGQLLSGWNIDEKQAETILYGSLFEVEDEISGKSRDNFIAMYEDAVKDWATEQYEKATTEEQRKAFEALSNAVDTAKSAKESFDSVADFAETVEEDYPAAAKAVKLSDDKISKYSVELIGAITKTKSFMSFMAQKSKLLTGMSKGSEWIDKIGKALETGEKAVDMWNMLQRFQAMQDNADTYSRMLKAIAENTDNEGIKVAANRMAGIVELNYESIADEIGDMMKGALSDVAAEKVMDFVSSHDSTGVFLGVKLGLTLGMALEQSTADSAMVCKTMAIQAEIAKAIAIEYESDMRWFLAENSDPSAKLDKARDVFYTMAMLLSVHKAGETTFTSDELRWRDDDQKEDAEKHIKIIDGLFGRQINPTAPKVSKDPCLWYATFMCPVDVDVYRNGRKIASITSKEENLTVGEDTFESFKVDGDSIKLVTLHGAPSEYSFKVRGTDSGTLVFATDVQSGGKRVVYRTDHLRVSPGSLFTVDKVDASGAYAVDVDQNGDGKTDSQAKASLVQQDKITVPTGISLSDKALSLKTGESASVGVTLEPANATMNGVTWSSSDSKIATVTANGRITGVNEGTATITATTFSKVRATVKVTVSKDEVNPSPSPEPEPSPTPSPNPSPTPTPTVTAVPVYRVYDRNSGLHHYTTSEAERDHLVRLGWRDEGTSFKAAKEDASNKNLKPVYREYNPNDGNHNWTMSKAEHDHLVRVGWHDEGVAWYVDASASTEVYRLYNPNSGEHVYTTSWAEYESVGRAGWHQEGVAWQSLD